MGDFLIVSVSRQKNAERIKKRKLAHSEQDRKKMLEGIKFVDKVVLGSSRDYLAHIKSQKPNIIVLGYDQKDYTDQLKEKLALRGLRVKIIRAKAYRPNIYKTNKLLRNL